MSRPIEGPYEFGDQPPYELMGWRPDLVPQARETHLELFTDFPQPEQPVPKVPTPTWELTKRILDGHHLPTFKQGTGDCVAAAIRQAGSRLQVAEMATLYEEELLKEWFVPFIYGISRVQIGGGQIPGPGSTGQWGAAAVRQYGVLFDEDPGVPNYSGDLSDRWGERPGPPRDFQLLAANNLVNTTARLKTIAQVRNALCNYYPVTVASNQGFKMAPEEEQGFHVWVPFGTWPHQMALIAWMDEPFQAAYRLNSWGQNAHGIPLNGEPPGGAWCKAQVLERELACASCEFFTYGKFAGWPSAADRGLLTPYPKRD